MLSQKDKFTLESDDIILFLEKCDDVEFWDIYVKNKSERIGFIRIHFDGIICPANVSGSDIFDEINQNKGYGSASVQMLANHYGIISSAANGSSSAQAFGMWRKSNAKKVDIDTLYTNYIYVLTKKE